MVKRIKKGDVVIDNELDYSERELEIISCRYGFNCKIETQRQISKRLNISRSYVSRIEKRALTKLYLFLTNETTNKFDNFK